MKDREIWWISLLDLETPSMAKDSLISAWLLVKRSHLCFLCCQVPFASAIAAIASSLCNKPISAPAHILHV